MTDNVYALNRHNENLNKLVRESLQSALIILLKVKPYQKISVTELCEKAGVSRMAFYGNYKTMDNLLESVVIEFNMTLINDKIGSPFRPYTTREWYEKMLSCIAEHADFLRVLFAAGFKDKYLSIITKLVLHDPDIPTEQKYLRVIWAGGIVNTIIFWLEHGMKETPHAMASMCYQNMSVFLRP